MMFRFIQCTVNKHFKIWGQVVKLQTASVNPKTDKKAWALQHAHLDSKSARARVLCMESPAGTLQANEDDMTPSLQSVSVMMRADQES
jgi:hypothetical protein